MKVYTIETTGRGDLIRLVKEVQTDLEAEAIAADELENGAQGIRVEDGGHLYLVHTAYPDPVYGECRCAHCPTAIKKRALAWSWEESESKNTYCSHECAHKARVVKRLEGHFRTALEHLWAMVYDDEFNDVCLKYDLPQDFEAFVYLLGNGIEFGAGETKQDREAKEIAEENGAKQ